MIAHHPSTGKPIHILRTETHISYDTKTIVWLRPTHIPSHRWKRWIPVISEIDAVVVCGAEFVGAVIIPHDADIAAWYPVVSNIYTVNSQCLFLATDATTTALSKLGFSTDRTLTWEELNDGYPYLGGPCTPESSIETIIISLAHILRIQKIVWTAQDTLDVEATRQFNVWKRMCSGSVVHGTSDDTCIPRLWLLQQYFQHPSTRRQKELTHCLHQNIACDYIDTIVLINEKDYPELPTSPKLRILRTEHRLTYKEVFLTIKAVVGAGDFVMFANADIYCDETLRALWSIPLMSRSLCLALLRWEEGQSSLSARSDNQDSWVVARDCVISLDADLFDFPFGKAGCDSAFALLMMQQRFLVANPARTIHTYHVHSSNIRNYDPKDLLYRPRYLYVEPTQIYQYTLQKDMKRYEVPQDETMNLSFQRPVHCVNEAAGSALCAQLSLQLGTCNIYTPPNVRIPLYRLTDGAFATCDGLLFNHQTVFVGSWPLWIQKWERTHHSSLVNAVHVPHLVVLPFGHDATLENWVLYYLPQVLRVRELAKSRGLFVPEFLVPQVAGISSLLSDFHWKNTESITVNPMSSDIQYWSEDIWCIPPTTDNHRVTVEDVLQLRSLLPAYPLNSNTVPVAVLCVADSDETVCNRQWADNVAQYILSDWKIRIVSSTDTPAIRRKAFMEASWILGSGVALDWLWMAKPGTTVMEFVDASCTDIDKTHVHLAGASDVRYCLSVIQPDLLENQRQTAMLEVGQTIRKFGFKATLATLREVKGKRIPSISVPMGGVGFGAHGDGLFREMVELWAERKYITTENTAISPYYWWGSVGEVLLYDRPTLRWWNNDVTYQMAMFSCAAPGPVDRQSQWGFWSRSPRCLEVMAERYMNLRSYSDRSIQSIFLGRIGNGIQKAARTKEIAVNWGSCIERFSLNYDTTGAPLPLSQMEYLGTLCNTRFGLCLKGTGTHSSREIDYLACGCVPIVTPDVSMHGLLAPLKEGVHYLRVKTPEDVVRIVRETSADQWAKLSANGRSWWATYASAEGMFRLTWARIEQCRPYFNVGIPARFLP